MAPGLLPCFWTPEVPVISVAKARRKNIHKPVNLPIRGWLRLEPSSYLYWLVRGDVWMLLLVVLPSYRGTV